MASIPGHYSRERTRSLRTDTSGLFRTADFAPGAIATGTVFPYRTGDVTFAFEVLVTGAAPAGDVLVLGTTAQLKVTLSGADVVLSAGSAGNDGITITAADVLVGEKHKIVVAVKAGTGEARIWVDGRLRARGVSVGAQFPAGWADTGAGSYGTGLTDAESPGMLSVFMKQVPRHFDESLYT